MLRAPILAPRSHSSSNLTVGVNPSLCMKQDRQHLQMHMTVLLTSYWTIYGTDVLAPHGRLLDVHCTTDAMVAGRIDSLQKYLVYS